MSTYDEIPLFTDPLPGQVVLAVCPAERWPVSGWRRATRADLKAVLGRELVLSPEQTDTLQEFYATGDSTQELEDMLEELFGDEPG